MRSYSKYLSLHNLSMYYPLGKMCIQQIYFDFLCPQIIQTIHVPQRYFVTGFIQHPPSPAPLGLNSKYFDVVSMMKSGQGHIVPRGLYAISRIRSYRTQSQVNRVLNFPFTQILIFNMYVYLQ